MVSAPELQNEPEDFGRRRVDAPEALRPGARRAARRPRAEEAREIRRRDANHKASCDARRANLTKLLCGETTHGYDPFQHDESLKQEMNRFLQAKTFGACRPSHSTHERLFTKHEKPRKDVREQFIRDRELEGRPYDIVGHYTIERLPSHVPQRVNTQLAHPSQNGKEGRCTQGSLGRTPCLL